MGKEEQEPDIKILMKNLRKRYLKEKKRIGKTLEKEGIEDVEVWIHLYPGLLLDADRYAKRKLTKVLGKLGNATAVEVLTHILRDKDWWLRVQAAEFLGGLGDKRAVEPLIQALRDKERRVREFVVEALKEIVDKKAVEPLNQLLRDENENSEVRMNAAQILRVLDDEIVVDLFIQVLEDEDAIVRYSIARVLGELDNTRAVAPLIQTLKDEDKRVRRNAAEALGKIGDAKAKEPIIQILRDKKENSEVKKIAAKTLKLLGGEKTVEPLIEALKDENREVRMYSVQVLGELKDSRAVEPLIEALKDVDWLVRRLVAESLGKLGDARAVEPIIQILRDKKENSEVKKIAIKTLKLLGGEMAVEPLIKTLKEEDVDEWLRRLVAETLGKLEGGSGVEILIQILRDVKEDSVVRRQVAKTLGKLGGERAVEPLIQILRDAKEDSEGRKLATEALGKLDDAYDLLKEHVEKGEVFAIVPYIKLSCYMGPWDSYEPEDVLKEFSIDSIEEPELEAIMDLLYEDKNPTVRYAFYALGSIGDRRAAKVVITKMREIEAWKTNWPDLIEGLGFGGDWVLKIGMFADEFFDIIMKLDAIEEFVEIFKEVPTFFISVFIEIVENHSYKEVKRFFDALKDDPDYLIEALVGYMLHYDELTEGLRSMKNDIVSLKQSLTEENLILELQDILKHLREPKNEKTERIKKAKEFKKLIQKKVNKFQKSKDVKRTQILEELYTFLQSDNIMEIYYTLWALEKLQLSDTIEKILPLLEHWDRFTRRYAIKILGKIGDKRAIESLEQLLEKETNTITKEKIQEALNKLKAKKKKNKQT